MVVNNKRQRYKLISVFKLFYWCVSRDFIMHKK